MSAYAAWLILGMTAITFLGFRLGGYWVGGILPQSGRLAYVLDRLPAFVLIALLAPDVWNLGWIGFIAGGIVLAVTYLTGRALVALVIGVVFVALARSLGLIPVAINFDPLLGIIGIPMGWYL